MSVKWGKQEGPLMVDGIKDIPPSPPGIWWALSLDHRTIPIETNAHGIILKGPAQLIGGALRDLEDKGIKIEKLAQEPANGRTHASYRDKRRELKYPHLYTKKITEDELLDGLKEAIKE